MQRTAGSRAVLSKLLFPAAQLPTELPRLFHRISSCSQQTSSLFDVLVLLLLCCFKYLGFMLIIKKNWPQSLTVN